MIPSPTQYIVQLRGKTLCCVPVEQPNADPIPVQDFLPGDTLEKSPDGSTFLLVKRQAQATLGIVAGTPTPSLVQLHLPFFGRACPFRPVVKAFPGKTQIGSRYVLWLSSDGSIEVLRAFDPYNIGEEIDDVTILKAIYTETGGCPFPAPANISTMNFFTEPRYTKPFTNHNSLNTFTIDPETARDFDDAISIDISSNTLYIHITDIASASLSLEEEIRYRQRGQTLYLGNDATLHLLNEINATKNLSLLKGQERKVITVAVQLHETGTVQSYDIYPSTILVKHRLTYGQAEKKMKSKTNLNPPLAPPQPVDPLLQDLLWLKDLNDKRNANVNYSLTLPSLAIDEDDDLARISTTDDSHKMVATAMILANLLVSKHLADVKFPSRFHEKVVGFQGLPPHLKTGNEEVDSFILVKKFAKARYDMDFRGHFGLGLESYVHFTSPLRRYADVIVHRILAGTYNPLMLEDEIEQLNQRASLVKACHQQYMHWKVLRYLEDDPTYLYKTYITGVVSSGVRWFMPMLNLDGFAHVSTLEPKQKYQLLAGIECLTGETHEGSLFAFRQCVKGKVRNIDKVTGEVHLTLSIPTPSVSVAAGGAVPK